MNRWRPFVQLFLARVREFCREPEALFWVYGFPVLLAVGLGIAFSSREPEPVQVDIFAVDASEGQALVERLRVDGVKAEVHPEEECRQRLRLGKTALYV